MQRLDVSGAVRPIYGSLGVKRLIAITVSFSLTDVCLSVCLSVSVFPID